MFLITLSIFSFEHFNKIYQYLNYRLYCKVTKKPLEPFFNYYGTHQISFVSRSKVMVDLSRKVLTNNKSTTSFVHNYFLVSQMGL